MGFNASFLIVFFEPDTPNVFYRIRFVTPMVTERVRCAIPPRTSVYAIPFGGGAFRRLQ